MVGLVVAPNVQIRHGRAYSLCCIVFILLCDLPCPLEPRIPKRGRSLACLIYCILLLGGLVSMLMPSNQRQQNRMPFAWISLHADLRPARGSDTRSGRYTGVSRHDFPSEDRLREPQELLKRDSNLETQPKYPAQTNQVYFLPMF